MAERQFEVSKRAFIFKCSMAILLGSLIPAWVFIIWNYVETIKLHGYYSSPFSIVEMQLLCLPYVAYQLPAYLVSGIICISLVKRGWIKSALAAYLGVGISGWLVSTLPLSLFFVSSGDDDIVQFIILSLAQGLPSLLLYLVFLCPKSVQ